MTTAIDNVMLEAGSRIPEPSDSASVCDAAAAVKSRLIGIVRVRKVSGTIMARSKGSGTHDLELCPVEHGFPLKDGFLRYPASWPGRGAGRDRGRRPWSGPFAVHRPP